MFNDCPIFIDNPPYTKHVRMEQPYFSKLCNDNKRGTGYIATTSFGRG